MTGDRTCTIGLSSMSSTHWWPSSRLSNFTPYVIFCADLYHRTCLEGVHALVNKVTVRDSYFAYYAIDMAETCTVGLTSMASTHWWPSSSELPRISVILRHIPVGLASSGLHLRRSPSDEQSHGWIILTRISLIIKLIWPRYTASDSTNWWPSSRLSNFTSNFA